MLRVCDEMVVAVVGDGGGAFLFGVFLRLKRLGYCASVRALWVGVVAFVCICDC